jgi:hypothetical protein
VSKINGIEGIRVACERGCPTPAPRRERRGNKAREYQRLVDDLKIAAELFEKSARAA